ncbi:MAG: T9SS type A sorting domain-containing protein, partial [Clostridiales bacterium]
EAWQDSTFVKRWLTTRAYDEAGSLISVISQFPSGNSWENAFRITYTYDGNGNAVKGESFSWDEGEWEYSATPFSDYNFRYNWGKDQLDQLPVSGAVVKIRYDLLPEEDPYAIRDFTLSQNYPNPFNPSTAINYFIKSDGRVRLIVYDALGKVVTSVVDEYQTAGSYSVRFDGSRLPSGVYIYRLESGGYSTAKKFILLK